MAVNRFTTHIIIKSYRLFVFYILLILTTPLTAQKITVRGEVRNSLDVPVEFVNIIANSINDSERTQYDITNIKGEYSLILNAKSKYTLSIRSLNYKEQTLNISAVQDTVIHILLEDDVYNLDSIIIKEKRMPIRISGDTTIYNVRSFTAGDERKLKDVLNTLPGLEVNEEGGLKYKGIRVAKLLVEGKLFFGGNTKLGTDHIPANVVDQIEVIDRFSEIPMLQSTGISDELAINVKLKKDKKQFFFGDVSLGGGIEKRYEFVPNIFFYAPNLSVNSLNNVNNTFQQPLSFSDIIQFEGGNNRLINDGSGILEDIFSNFTNFLDFGLFKEREVQFSGLNVVHDISSKSKFESYWIYQDSKDLQSGGSNSTYFLDQNTSLNEVQRRTTTNDDLLLLGKIKLNHQTLKNSVYTFEYKFKYDNFNSDQSQNISRLQNTSNYFWNRNRTLTTHDFSFDFTKKHSSNSITNLHLSANMQSQDEDDLWRSDIPFLQAFNASIVRVNQTFSNEHSLFELSASQFYSFDDKNQITIGLQTNVSNINFTSNNHFFDSENTFLDVHSSSFNNDLPFELYTTRLGMEYKLGSSKRNIATKINGYYYNYTLVRDNNNSIVAVPEIEINQEIENIGNLKLSYSYGINLPISRILLPNNYLVNSFTLQRGSINANETRSHNITYHFRRYDIFRNFAFEINGRLQYANRGNIYRSSFIGFEQYQELIPVTNANSSWRTEVKIKKQIGKLNYEPLIVFNRSAYAQFQNDALGDFTNTSLKFGLKITRAQRKKLRFTGKIDHTVFFFNNFNVTSRFRRTRISLDQNIKLGRSILLKLSNDLEYNQNTQEENTFIPIANIGLEYRINDKWMIELYLDNLFNVDRNVISFQNDILVSDTFNEIQSFFGLVRLNYTL